MRASSRAHAVANRAEEWSPPVAQPRRSGRRVAPHDFCNSDAPPLSKSAMAGLRAMMNNCWSRQSNNSVVQRVSELVPECNSANAYSGRERELNRYHWSSSPWLSAGFRLSGPAVVHHRAQTRPSPTCSRRASELRNQGRQRDGHLRRGWATADSSSRGWRPHWAREDASHSPLLLYSIFTGLSAFSQSVYDFCGIAF